MIVDKINKYLSSQGTTVTDALLNEFKEEFAQNFIRQFTPQEPAPNNPRVSSIGSCLRKQSYKLNDYEIKGKEIDSRGKLVFFSGDQIESTIASLAKLAGCPITQRQKEVEVEGIKGHIDGVYQECLVEIKSMSSFAFQDFEKGIINKDYIYQYNLYLEGLGLDEVIYIGFDKNSCVLGEQIFRKDPDIVADGKQRIRELQALGGNLLPKEHAPNDKRMLPWQCLYCPYWGHCWPQAEKVLVGRSYKLRLPKEAQNET